MAFRKYIHSVDGSSASLAPLEFSRKVLDKGTSVEPEINASISLEADVDIDLREVYFLIMHFLSAGPCKRTYGQLWNELLEHQLLPRRYHAWYSRTGARSGDEDDDGMSLPLCYLKLVERYPHVGKDHLVKLLKQLLAGSSPQPHSIITGGAPPSAADVPTLLGSGSFSLLGCGREREDTRASHVPGYLRWPHMQADQVHGLSLRELGGGFPKHHRAPSVRAACYAIAKPSTMVQKMQIIKKLRGHQNAVYCAMYDRSGRYVITGSDDRLVKIWSMETAFCLASCRGHEGDITDLAVSSNNVMVASSSNDFIIRVWHLPDGRPISVLRGHTGVVTAIAFSPRPNAAYQLLSSSDDGTCRIWDARNSQQSPRIFTPKPPEVVSAAGKGNDPPPASTSQQSRQILCCAFNANGTVFVTGSADTHARVWSVWKNNIEDPEQPNHEMDLLAGHENDVNYVQFSGCAVASRSSTSDHLKEDNLPKFKNSWFTHDNIVTCSRDGSAIIWIPRSRRSHGKVGRWTRSYHLKVPPPPMPPQPPRGGPRQRFQPTPRGVNMIMWSLDNRFVLAAIMDCRICVWNASDGSLVHSLIGHSESTFVLDVHPFNPRIAMSAGYDGKTIIWDIWEGTPVQIYETGRFKLVDGKFSPDGTSIVLSDEVGQIFIIATGQGESQKDAKYDQFFLGDYRPLIQDANGNVLDQESQLVPYRRNIQDLLCDSSMIPYPESYQNMFQQRRLGALGYEWRPPSVKFAVGPTYNSNTGEYQILPIIDLDRWVEPMPQFIDWEQEFEVQSDDTDSEYNVTDEYSSEGEHVSLHGSSSGDSECSAEDSAGDLNSREGLRRSKRKKHKSEVELTTSSGRHVKRRNLDKRDGATTSRTHKTRKTKKGPSSSKKKSTSKSLRPQRRAARNALNFFSKITSDSSDEEDEEDPESFSSESESLPESNSQSVESEQPMQRNQVKHCRESDASRDEGDGSVQQLVEAPANGASNRRLVLKLPRRDSKVNTYFGNRQPDCSQQDFGTNPSANNFNSIRSSNIDLVGDAVDAKLSQNGIGGGATKTWHGESSASTIRWGEVKVRTSKRLKLGDSSPVDVWSAPKIDGPVLTRSDNKGHPKYEDENQTSSNSQNRTSQGLDGTKGKNPISSPVPHNGDMTEAVTYMDTGYNRNHGNNDYRHTSEPPKGFEEATDNKKSFFSTSKNPSEQRDAEKNAQPNVIRLRIKPNGSVDAKLKSAAVEDWRSSEHDLISKSSSTIEQNLASAAPEAGDGTKELSQGHSPYNNNESHSLDPIILSPSHDSKKPDRDSGKMYKAVYKRTKSSISRKSSEGDAHSIEEGQESSYDHSIKIKMNCDDDDDVIGDLRRTRSMGTRASRNERNSILGNVRMKEGHGSLGASTSGGNSGINARQPLLCDEWKSTSGMTVGLRSARNRRESNNMSLKPAEKRKCNQPARKVSWLMLLKHEVSYRYIPQQGDEVAYLRQGHEEYIEFSRLQLEAGPWKSVSRNLKAVEFCKVCALDYSTLPGSGESCCKLTLEFTDPSSSGFGRTFMLTLPELVSFSDFIVERTRYDYAIERNWTTRDKCQVWWRNEDGDGGGSWWEGRISAVKPKSSEFSESPWERYTIRYKEDSTDHLHSPWEFHDAETQWEHPHIDEVSRDKLVSCLARIEQTSTRNQDNYGIEKLNQISRQPNFINRFPVQLSFDVIKSRLENNYYRHLEAVKHDAEVMLSNAESYFGRNPEMANKIRRLAEWMEGAFLKL